MKRLKFVENKIKIKKIKMSNNSETSDESLKLNPVKREEFVIEQKVQQKDQWGNEIEFLLSCITLSVGLGNVWRYRKEN